MARQKPQLVSVSIYSILKFVGVGLALYFLWYIRDIVGVVFVAWVFASAIDPAVDFLQKKKVPRAISLLSILGVALGFLVLVGILLVPPIATELGEIADVVPEYVEEFKGLQESVPFDIEGSLQGLSDQVAGASTQVLGFIFGIFGGIFTFLGVVVLTFYMTVEEDAMKKFIRQIAPLKFQPFVIQKIHKVQKKMGSWLRGQLILMVIIGTLTYIGLLILGVEYALVLALLAGLLEFVPVLGPILAAIPAVFFAFVQNPVTALLVIILFVIIQQLENNVIVPRVMKRSVGLNPLITIIGLLVGAKIAGIVGMLLAVPVIVIGWVFIEDLFTEKKKEEAKLEE